MNPKLLITLWITCALIICGCTDSVKQKELEAAKRAASEMNIQLESVQVRLSASETKLKDTSAALAKASESLAQAKSLIADYEKTVTKNQAERARIVADQKYVDSVPAFQSADGLTFPQLLSPSSVVLMTNASFVMVKGRKVTFKSGPTMAAAYDVSEIHPAILMRLNIDGEKAKANQAALDEKEKQMRAAMAQVANGSFQAHAQWQEKWNKEQAKLAKEQAREDEIRRQQQVLENQRQQDINNDNLRARAAVISALHP